MIISPQNPEVKKVVKLKRRKNREETGLFIIEGIHLLEMAMAAAVSLESVFFTEPFSSSEAGRKLLPSLEVMKPQCNMVSESVFAKMADTESPQGILAIAKTLPDAKWERDVCGGAVIILDRIQDPGNLGTIIRTADSAGVDCVVLLQGTVDLHNPKVIRSSMGSVFNVPVIHQASFPECLLLLQEKAYRIIAADMHGEQQYFDADMKGKIALVIGSEGEGLQNQILESVDVRVRIPMYGQSESLNVAVACGILLYESLRQRIHP